MILKISSSINSPRNDDRERYKLTPILSNGTTGGPIELYGLFETFLREVDLPGMIRQAVTEAVRTASLQL